MKEVCRLFLCILISLSFPLYAQNIPSEPILVLSMEMHTASIRGIASDAQGRYLLTASDDKTGRLWDAGSSSRSSAFLSLRETKGSSSQRPYHRTGVPLPSGAGRATGKARILFSFSIQPRES